MALGFNADGTQMRPDKSFKRQIKPKTRIAKFGDGYEQRASIGINSINETYNVNFKTRPKAEVDDVVVFLNSKKGVTAFDYVIPDTNVGGGETTIKVVCESYDVSYDYGDFYSLTTKLRRVYEA